MCSFVLMCVLVFLSLCVCCLGQTDVTVPVLHDVRSSAELVHCWLATCASVSRCSLARIMSDNGQRHTLYIMLYLDAAFADESTSERAGC